MNSLIVTFFTFLFLLLPGMLSAEQTFDYLVKDINLDGRVDYLEIKNENIEIELDTKTGGLTKYKLTDKKFKAELIPAKKTDGIGFGLLRSGGKLVEFSFDTVEIKNRELRVALKSEKNKRFFTFYRGKYFFREELTPADGMDSCEISFGPYIDDPSNAMVSWMADKNVQVNFQKALKSVIPAQTKFLAFLASYYNFTVLPEAGEIRSITAVPATAESAVMTEGVKLSLAFSLQRNLIFTAFLGPNDPEMLKEVKAEELINFGFFSSIAQSLLSVMKFFHNFCGNWGLAIILLTVLIKILLHPLTYKQTISMEEMKKVQPIVNNIRERFKSDPQKLNVEIMKVYKEHNINPLGGCLPVLIQLPILFALFTALRLSIDLKGEAFLWIPDLALPDPTLALPLLVALTTFYQQKMMPSSPDPTQQTMMFFMPFLMFIFAKALAAGVVLYWFVSTLLGTIEQKVIALQVASRNRKNPTKGVKK
ncbi:MAG: membrane protein insertase YidC [Candidatus Wallbacteria bacterium]|nr:membrane protein insertase YidC [Candidatus Wallbacteria bacterium]